MGEGEGGAVGAVWVGCVGVVCGRRRGGYRRRHGAAGVPLIIRVSRALTPRNGAKGSGSGSAAWREAEAEVGEAAH